MVSLSVVAEMEMVEGSITVIFVESVLLQVSPFMLIALIVTLYVVVIVGLAIGLAMFGLLKPADGSQV